MDEILTTPEDQSVFAPGNGMFLELEDFTAVYMSCSRPPTFVNDLDQNDVASRERLNELLLTTYESDVLESVPTCQCRQLRGGTTDKNLICPNCNHPISIPAEREIESSLWIRAPDNVRTLLHPLLLGYLDRFFGSAGGSYVQYVMDPYYKPRKRTIPMLEFDKTNHRRGLNYFVDNFDVVFDFMLYESAINKTRKQKDKFRNFILSHRNKLFTWALPIPSKITFIVELTATGKFGDGNMASALDAVRTIGSISSGIEPLRETQLESKAFRACLQLTNFYDAQYSKTLSPKAGWFRRHVFGSRPAFSFRAVISSLSERHRYNETHLPWSLAVSLFKQHLRNKLQSRGFSPSQSNKYIQDHIETYSPLLDELFTELINEATEQSKREAQRKALPFMGGLVSMYQEKGMTKELEDLQAFNSALPQELEYDIGIPCIIQRNPSLKRLSAQRFFITKIKKDPSINTISLSVLVLKGPNKSLFRPLETLGCNSPNCGECLLKVNLPTLRRKSVGGQFNQLGMVKIVDLGRSTQRSTLNYESNPRL